MNEDVGALVVLDPRDKTPTNDGKHWRHGSTMATTDGITVTYTFRCAQTSILVNGNGTLVNPYIDSKRLKIF